MEYHFTAIDRCNMCAAPIDDAKVLGRRLSRSQGLRPTRRPAIATTVMRCGSCGLVFSNPQPVPIDLGQHYDTPPESYWKTEDLAEDPEYFAGAIDRFHELWRGNNNAPPAALDIGAGIGMGMRKLALSGFNSHGIEPSPAFRQAAIDHAGIPADRIQLATAETADLPAHAFDFISFGAVLEHLPDPAGSIERALHWLAPGGLIHIEVPSAGWLTARLFNAAYRLQGLDYVTNLSPMHPPYHLYEFTPASFRAHAARAGYELAFYQYQSGRDTFLPGPDRAWRRLMKITGTGMQVETWLRSGS